MLTERHVPEGLHFKGNRKRRSLRTSASAPRGARSLDSFNHLATSVKNDSETYAEWLKRHTDASDKRRRLYSIHDRLLDSLKAAGLEEKYLRQEANIEAASGSGTARQDHLAKRGKRAWWAWKDYERVSGCQTEFIGFQPTCCDGRGVAVPIGCNHRLCPLCSAHRAEHYRERVRALFEIVGNPQMLTLTVPNCHLLTRETFSTIRKHLRAFLRENKALLMGGVYSIECTFNRIEKTWHPHIHALVDVNDTRKKLPYWEFCARKWKLEFSWLILTQGKPVPGRRFWKKGEFDDWVSGVDPRRCGGNYSRVGVRRTIDLRPVSSDKKAAYEVLKYITKAAQFVDDHRAVAEFLRAVKGVRAIQTFGSCYGFKLEEKPVEAHLECGCGKNKFERVGTLSLGMTIMSKEGKWYIREDAPRIGRLRCRGKTNHTERQLTNGSC